MFFSKKSLVFFCFFVRANKTFNGLRNYSLSQLFSLAKVIMNSLRSSIIIYLGWIIAITVISSTIKSIITDGHFVHITSSQESVRKRRAKTKKL